jgi:dienelactone hydrolase
MVWPEREDLSFEFSRVLVSAQDGGSTLSECWRTAKRIDINDDNSWFDEWIEVADSCTARAVAAFREGNISTARSSWLRAMNYYLTATFPCDGSVKAEAAIALMRGAAKNYLHLVEPASEIVTIPWLDGNPLQGYFLPAAGTAKPAPTVICIGEPGQRKEQLLFRVARYAKERGLAMLAVDLCGSESGNLHREMAGSEELETAISHIMDFVVRKPEVDADRVAIVADDCASSFVARSIAFDRRFAAAVCDGGMWDLQEAIFLKERFERLHSARGSSAVATAVRKIRCPLLVTVGEHGWIEADRVRMLYDRLHAERRNATLRIFGEHETGAKQGHADNPALANEFIFDWVACRLKDVRNRTRLRSSFTPQEQVLGKPSPVAG